MKNEIERILEEETRGTHLFVVELDVNSNRVDIFLDGDAGVNIGECAILNRQLHRKLEEKGIDAGNYIIDVSSPGIDRPLTQLREYKKNVGRKLEVQHIEGKASTGKLVYVDEEKFILKTGGGYKTKKEIIYYNQVTETISTI